MGSREKSTEDILLWGQETNGYAYRKLKSAQTTLMKPQSSTTYYLPAIELIPTQIHDMGTNALNTLRYVYCRIDVVARHAMSISEADVASIHPRMQSSNTTYQSTMVNEAEGRASLNWDECMELSSWIVLQNTGRCCCGC